MNSEFLTAEITNDSLFFVALLTFHPHFEVDINLHGYNTTKTLEYTNSNQTPSLSSVIHLSSYHIQNPIVHE